MRVCINQNSVLALPSTPCVGIARCFAFGGGRSRPLFSMSGGPLSTHSVVSPEHYASRQKAGCDGGSSLEHFFEKLLRLKSMMLTKHGKKLAEARHSFIVDFIYELGVEIGGEEGGVLIQHCESEDDSRIAYGSMHNGVILCLLDDELGDRVGISGATGAEVALKKKQLEEKEEEEAESTRLFDTQNAKFHGMFREGLVGLIVESLDLDSWFSKKK